MVYIPDNHKRNTTGKPFLIFCINDQLELKTAIKVCLYRGVWHRVNRKEKLNTLGELLPSIHDFDQEEKDDPSESESEPDTTNQQIRDSPIQTVTPLPGIVKAKKAINVQVPTPQPQNVAQIQSATSSHPPTQQSLLQLASPPAKMATTNPTSSSTATQAQAAQAVPPST